MIKCSFVGIRKNQKERNTLAGTTLADMALAATIEEAMSPFPRLTHSQHQ